MMRCADCGFLSVQEWRPGETCIRCGSSKTQYHPTQEDIAKATAEIRARWSPEVEEQRRAVGQRIRFEFVRVYYSGEGGAGTLVLRETESGYGKS